MEPVVPAAAQVDTAGISIRMREHNLLPVDDRRSDGSQGSGRDQSRRDRAANIDHPGPLAINRRPLHTMGRGAQKVADVSGRQLRIRFEPATL